MSANARYPWSVLGLSEMPNDPAISRKSYARALKQIDQAKDIQGFEKLRAAYDQAMRMHKSAGRGQMAAPVGPAPQQDDIPAARAPIHERPLTPHAADIAPELPHPAERHPETTSLQSTLQMLATFRNDTTFSARVQQALDGPWAKDAMTLGTIRTAIASALRQMPIRHWAEHDNLHLEITADILRRLDDEYKWLTDSTSFERDFGQDVQLMHHLLVRSSGGSIPKFKAPPKPRTGIARELNWLAENTTVFVFLFSIVIVLSSLIASHFDSKKLYTVVFTLFFVALFSFAYFLVQQSIFNQLKRKNHRLTAKLASFAITTALAFILYLQSLYYFVIIILSLLLFMISIAMMGPKLAVKLESKLLRLWNRIGTHFEQ